MEWKSVYMLVYVLWAHLVTCNRAIRLSQEKDSGCDS